MKEVSRVSAEPEFSPLTEEQAELRRSLDVGLVRIDGRLALLTQCQEQDAKAQEELAHRVGALERARWPLHAIAALTSVGALVVALWQSFGH